MDLWWSDKEDALGLAWYETLGSGDRIHGIWLEPPGLGTLSRFLPAFARARPGPTVAVTDLIPTISDPAQASYFEPRGFWHRAKVLMRREGRWAGPARSEVPQIHPITRAYLPAIVEVYVRAYSERPGEFWTWGREPGEARSEGEHDVMRHVTSEGAWAPSFLPEASFVWQEEGRVVGAVLVEEGRNGLPYIEDLIVEPSFHRKRIGRTLMERSLEQLSRRYSHGVELAAIRDGAPYWLYQKLGFRDVLGPAGQMDGHWIRGPKPF